MPAKRISKKAVDQWLNKKKSGGPVFNKKGIRVPGMFQDGGNKIVEDTGVLDEQRLNRFRNAEINDQYKNISEFDPNNPPTPIEPKEQWLIDSQKYAPIDPKSDAEKIIPGGNVDQFKEQQILKSKRSNPFSGYKKGGQKRKEGGAVFNRNGARVPGMRKGR